MLKQKFIVIAVIFAPLFASAQGSIQGLVRISGSNGNIISLSAGTPSSTFTLTFPPSPPSNGSVLYGTAGGQLQWNATSPANVGQVLQLKDIAGVPTPTWVDPGAVSSPGSFVTYNTNASQATSVLRSNYLFNIGYDGAADDAHAVGAVIASTGGGTHRNATALTLTATATGVGTATGLRVASGGGATSNAIDAVGSIRLLSNSGVPSKVSFQNPAGTFSSTFVAADQSANINYTLPIAAPAVTGQVLSSTVTGELSWTDPDPGSYINNATTQQPSANFNISGNGQIAGQMQLKGSGIGTTNFQAGDQGATDITYTLPTTQATTSGMVLVNDGSGNLGWHDMTSTNVQYARNLFDDFVMSELDGGGASDHTEFSYTHIDDGDGGSGSSSNVELTDATSDDYLGRHILTTGTSSTGSSYLSTFGGINRVIVGGKTTVYETRVRLETSSSSSVRYLFYTGLMNTNSTGAPSNGIYFTYTDNVNSGNWQCITRSSSTSTTINTSIPIVANQWYTLRCQIDPGTPDQANFYIDDVLVATSTTDLPTSAMRYTVKMNKTSGSGSGTSRTASTDWLLLKMLR